MQKKIVTLATLGLTAGVATLAYADEPSVPASPQATSSEDARPRDREPQESDAHSRLVRELNEKTEVARLQGRYEQTLRLNEFARTHPPGTPDVVWRPRRGVIVLPDLVGFSAAYTAGAAYGGLGNLYVTGPISVGSTSSSDGTGSSSIALTPSADVFVTDHVSIGTRLGIARQTLTMVTNTSATGATLATSEGSGYSLAIAPRVGYALPLGRVAVFWPKLGISAGQFRNEWTSNPTTLGFDLGFELEAGVVFPLSRRVIFQLAPELTYQHSSIETGARSTERDGLHVGTRARLGIVL